MRIPTSPYIYIYKYIYIYVFIISYLYLYKETRNAYDDSVAVIDEVHTLMRDDYAEQRKALAAHLKSAKNMTLAGFTVAPARCGSAGRMWWVDWWSRSIHSRYVICISNTNLLYIIYNIYIYMFMCT